MQIPTGNFGNRLPQVRQSNVSTLNAATSKKESGLFKSILTEVNAFIEKKDANNKLEAENQLLAYQESLDGINNQVIEQYTKGEINYQQLADKRQQLLDKLPSPNFDKLAELDKKRFLLNKDKLLYSNKASMDKYYLEALKLNSRDNVESYVNNAITGLEKPDADLPSTQANVFGNQDFEKAGQFSYDENWLPKKDEINQRFEQSYLQSQMKHASEADNIEALQGIRNSLMDEKQFTALTPLAKRQFIQQADALIDITAGKSYGKKMVSGFSQLLEKTGDFSAIKAYQAFSALQNNELAAGQQQITIESAKTLAESVGTSFDEQRFQNDQQYLKELQQNYFNQALDQYGSPLMATLALQVGDKQLNQWFQQLGDPSKNQISEDDFIAKVPDKKVRQSLQNISQQLKDSPTDKFNIEASLAAIDNDKSLNNNQKRYAKAEFRQYAENLQKQQQQFYKENREDVWRDLFINNLTISDINPEKITNLEKIGGAELFEKNPANNLDLNLLQEARGRVKTGESFDLIRDYFGKIPNQQLENLITLQKDIDSNPDKKNRLMQFTAAININAQAIGIVNNKVMSRLYDIITQEIETVELNTGRKINQEELQQITDKQMILAKMNGASLLADEDNYQEYDQTYITNINQVPEMHQQQIKEALAINDMPVTDESIIKYFNKGLGYV